MFIYSNVYWESGGFFGLAGRAEGGMWEDISMEELFIGKENFNEGAWDFLASFE